jgi:hypothetical protein
LATGREIMEHYVQSDFAKAMAPRIE